MGIMETSNLNSESVVLKFKRLFSKIIAEHIYTSVEQFESEDSIRFFAEHNTVYIYLYENLSCRFLYFYIVDY